MKRIVGVLVGLVVVASLGVAPATPAGDCGGPVDAACTDRKNTPNNPNDDELCVVFVTGVNPAADGCYNQNDLPA